MRCGVCGSERLSPLGELVSGEKWGERLRLRFARSGLLRPRPEFEAGLARACLDCGALLPFLSEEARRRLEATAGTLTTLEQPD
jgi:hypothetical protein